MTERTRTILQYIECTRTLDGTDEKLNCMCVKGSIDDNVDYTLKPRKACGGSTFFLGDGFGIELLATLRGIVHVL